MKRILVFALLALGLQAHAGIIYSGKLVPGTTTLNTTFSVSDNTDVSVANATKFGGQLCVFNNNAAEVAVNLDNDLATTAPTANVNDVYLPPNSGASGFCTPIMVRLSRTILFRSNSGSAISSGGSIYWYITDRKG